MIAVRLVVDTNIVVSAALKLDSLQRTVLILALTKPATLYVTEAILAEYRDVLKRPRIAIPKGLRRQLLQLITDRARSVRPARIPQVASDPDDNMFFGMRRRRARRLPGDGESEALSEILEEDQGDHVT